MLKKIGFTGSHGVGKTTLLYQVAGELQSLGINTALVNETARKTKFQINSQTTPLAQTDILALQLHDELEQHARKADFVLTDRTAVDAVAYSILGEREGRLEKGWASAMLPIALKWLQTYDLVIFVEPFGDLVKDKERWTSRDAQLAINDILRALYRDNNCSNIVTIDSNCPLSERKDIALTEIRRLLQ